MNPIKKMSLKTLGYDFITDFPKGKDEYYLRNKQNRSGIAYRQLTAQEIEILVRNGNTSDDWSKIQVSDLFNPELVKNCTFFGLNRIGHLENTCLGFSDLIVPVGLYNSTIISCDFGNNVSIHNVNYMSHYILGNEVIVNNVNELVTTNHSKFGNGIIKKGETEDVRIWLELCNENTGRKVMPFVNMTSGDAFLWTRNRQDKLLQSKFMSMAEKKFDNKLGYYGKVGDRTVIKNCKIIKDVWIGSDAYLKGANKIKNVTINSAADARTQIGEGCELVNGIVGYGCKIFYGIKAVRFIVSDHSQLKYGARLINSYLGENATISCCEVLNSLIFPAHEQHHNNSFLCAATLMGQSNIAAGATIGSNHNSRGADGEVIMGRGFWPGLCVSVKHNSMFASFSLLNKGDYNYELNIPIPFSLISNDPLKDELIIMPGYWFLYNFYALARNASKYIDRDKRITKSPIYEYAYLAPDTVNELLKAKKIIATAVAKASLLKQKDTAVYTDDKLALIGDKILSTQTKKEVDSLTVFAEGIENSKRKTRFIKCYDAYHMFNKMIFMYGMDAFTETLFTQKTNSLESALKQSPSPAKDLEWMNVGGQLIPQKNVQNVLNQIKNGAVEDWDQMHEFYQNESAKYEHRKKQHALAVLELHTHKKIETLSAKQFSNWLEEYLQIKTEVAQKIKATRAKDYSNQFRKMVYLNEEEMNVVVGKLEDNSFINQQMNNLETLIGQIAELKQRLKIK